VSAGHQAFEALVGELDYPMYIVTAAHRGERDGCLVGFATQCSIHPARFLACMSDKNRTYRIAEEADTLVVHVVPSDADDLVELFGGETGDEVDKLSQVEWSEGPDGVPVLARCPNWFAGSVLDRVRLGDHVGYLLEPVAGEHGVNGLAAFPFSRAKHVRPGHEP
jgi:flavin reductase (DIM6/NTAB) family NADH-FMN oxidoreductase RutF